MISLITPGAAQAYQVVAAIESKAASFFSARGSANAPTLKTPGPQTLKTQLQNTAQTNPAGIGVIFNNLSDVLDFASVLGGKNPILELPIQIVHSAANFFAALFAPVSDPKDLLTNVKNAIDGLIQSQLNFGVTMLPQFIKGQLSVAISVISTFGQLKKATIPQKVEEAYISYLFDTKGFQTIDGDSIAPPTHLSDFADAALSSDLNLLKNAFSEKSAVRYVRDLVRLPIEASCDDFYNLPTRLNNAVASAFPAAADKDAGRAKIVRWMKGFSTMAEAAVTGAVEEACSGVGSFQTNQLIAASAGTFAGTWARKTTQDLFLSEIA